MKRRKCSRRARVSGVTEALASRGAICVLSASACAWFACGDPADPSGEAPLAFDGLPDDGSSDGSSDGAAFEAASPADGDDARSDADSSDADADPAGASSTEGNPDVVNATETGGDTGGDGPDVGSPDSAAIPPGDGFFTGGQCFPRCDGDETDPDPDTGEVDGFGFEFGASCIVVDAPVALASVPCIPAAPDGSDIPPGDGFFVGEQCFAPCTSELTVDEQGFGFERQRSCVLDGSEAASRAVPCIPPPVPFDLIPGDGFFMEGEEGLTCFAPCVAAAVDEQGFGFEQQRSCVAPGSIAALRGIPCVPEPPDVLGLCPVPLDCPVSDGQTIGCGCTHVEGLGLRKQEILAAGGDRRFLASAMMETPDLRANYPFGDVFPGPDGQTGTPDDSPKTGGAANFGITKMNWGMIRQCHGDYGASSNADYLRGAELNDDLSLDVQVYGECRDFFGDGWYGGHRAGNVGLNNADVRRFRAGTDWTFEMLDGHLDDDVRFFVQIQAI